MDNFTRGTLIWLSLQLTLMGTAITKMAYDLGFERGKVSALTTFVDDADVGTCFVSGKCK